MELQNILARFSAFSGLTGAALTACEPLCADAMAEVSRQRGAAEGGISALNAYAAALANYRYLLAALSGSSRPRVGHVPQADAAAIEAAEALLAQYRAAAAPWLCGCGVAFRQVAP